MPLTNLDRDTEASDWTASEQKVKKIMIEEKAEIVCKYKILSIFAPWTRNINTNPAAHNANIGSVRGLLLSKAQRLYTRKPLSESFRQGLFIF